MKLLNVIVNGIEYTLVDTYDFNDEKIYHFLSDDDDLFCTKNEQDKYEIIKDEEKIKKIQEENNLIMPDILFSKDSKNIKKIITEIKKEIERIKQVNDEVDDSEEVDPSIAQNIRDEVCLELSTVADKDEVKKMRNILEKVKIRTSELTYQPGLAGFYVPKKEYMVFRDTQLQSDFINSKRTRLHENIHVLNSKSMCKERYHGLREGATESLTELILGKERGFIDGNIEFNLSFYCEYREQVSIIRQMECALGKSIKDETLGIKYGFFDEFRKKYGRDLFRFISHRTMKMCYPKYHILEERFAYDLNKVFIGKGIDEEEAEYFEETQNVILTRVFDKDFKDIESIKDARAYFEKLQKFEFTRGRVGKSDFFERYYKRKFRRAKQLLREKGFDSEKIEESLEKYKYEKRDFLPSRSKEEIINYIREFGMNDIGPMVAGKIMADKIIKGGFPYSVDDAKKKVKVYMSETPRKDGGYVVLYEVEGNPILVQAVKKYHNRSPKDSGRIYSVSEMEPNSILKNDEKDCYSARVPRITETLQLENIGLERTLYEISQSAIQWTAGKKTEERVIKENYFEDER